MTKQIWRNPGKRPSFSRVQYDSEDGVRSVSQSHGGIENIAWEPDGNRGGGGNRYGNLEFAGPRATFQFAQSAGAMVVAA